MGNSNLRLLGLLLLAALSQPISAASAAGKAYVFLGGRLDKLSQCEDDLIVHSRGNSGSKSVSSAVERTKKGETIIVAGHSDGSIFASIFIKSVKEEHPGAKIKYINFEGFRPNGGGRPDVGYSNLVGIQGLQIICVTTPGAPNFSFLKPGNGCTMVPPPPMPANCGSWCLHYAVMDCKYLK